MKTRPKLHRFALIAVLGLLSVMALAAPAFAMAEAPAETANGGCIVGGCSGTLCMDVTAESMATTCEWSPSYACYGKTSECKRQADGQCGWTQNPALKACLANPPGNGPY